MAPFSRGKSNAYRGALKSRRGGPARRNGGRRGGKKPGTNLESAFFPTRVEENAQDAGEDNMEQARPKELLLDGLSVEASDDSENSDDELPMNNMQSYSTLLQSLTAKSQQSESPRKRRKIESQDTLDVAETVDEDLAEVEEPEVVGELEEASDDDQDTSKNDDPFTRHFSDRDEASLAQAIQGLGDSKPVQAKLMRPEGWSTMYTGPLDGSGGPNTREKTSVTKLDNLSLKQKLRESCAQAASTIWRCRSTCRICSLSIPRRTFSTADTRKCRDAEEIVLPSFHQPHF